MPPDNLQGLQHKHSNRQLSQEHLLRAVQEQPAVVLEERSLNQIHSQPWVAWVAWEVLAAWEEPVVWAVECPSLAWQPEAVHQAWAGWDKWIQQ